MKISTRLLLNVPLFIAAIAGIFMMAGFQIPGIIMFFFAAVIQSTIYNQGA